MIHVCCSCCSFEVRCSTLPWSSEAYLLAESGAREYLDPKIWSGSKRSILLTKQDNEDKQQKNKKLEKRHTKLESKFYEILVSFRPTEAAAWCWYEAFGPHLVFLNGTSSANILKTCKESCILSSDAQCTRCEWKYCLPTVFQRCSQHTCVSQQVLFVTFHPTHPSSLCFNTVGVLVAVVKDGNASNAC